jgi:hypothetical protein
LSFWTSGEDARFPGNAYNHDGIFGLDVSGFSTEYLAVPHGGSSLGMSHVYEFTFVPSTSTVTFEFTNWGHYFGGTTGWTLPSTTELVMDDVILNDMTSVPEPSVLAMAATGVACLLAYVRRGQRSA